MFGRNKDEYQHTGRLNGEGEEHTFTLNEAPNKDFFKDDLPTPQIRETEKRRGGCLPLLIILILVPTIVLAPVFLPKIIYNLGFSDNVSGDTTIEEVAEEGIVIDKHYEKDEWDEVICYIVVEKETTTDDGGSTHVEQQYKVPQEHFIQMEIGTKVEIKNGKVTAYIPLKKDDAITSSTTS